MAVAVEKLHILLLLVFWFKGDFLVGGKEQSAR